MCAAWITASRLTPPDPPDGALARVWPGAEAPITLLAAGPGYGKSQALAGLLRAAPDGAVRAWLACDAYDADAAEFFHHLLAAVRLAVPGAGAALEAALAGGRSEPRALWERLFADLAAYGGPGAWLAIDDLHLLAEGLPDVLAGLGPALGRLPAGVRLLLATRKQLALPLARLEAQGRVARLGLAELAFTPEDAARFAAARGVAPDALLAEALAGWPLGWDLATRAGIDPAAARERLLTGAGALADYVAEERYRAHAPERQAFMREAAQLEAITPDAMRAVFGRGDAAPTLEQLAADHLVDSHEGGAVRVFPPYVRAFLMAESRRVDPAPVRAGWQDRAAAWYEGQDRPDLALAHRLAAEDWPRAAALLARVAPAMRFSGRHAALARWLAAFPGAIADAEPALLLARGHALARTGATQEALACYQRAREAYVAAGDAAGEVKALVRLAYVALVSHDLAQAGPLLLAAQARQADAEPVDLADLHLSRGFIAEQRGDPELMRECHEAVLAVPAGRDVDVAASHAVALLNLYTAHLNAGDLEQADAACARAVAVADAWGFRPYAIFAAFLRAHLALAIGQPEAADQALRGLPATWREALDWHDLGCAETILGERLQQAGDHKAAEEAFHKATAVFTEAGFAQGLKLVAERQAWLALARKSYPRVAAIVAGARLGDGSLYDWAPRLPAARALDLAGQSAAAVAGLDAAIAGFEGLGAGLHATRARLFRAAARARLGDAAGARADREAAEAAIAERGWGFLHGQDQALWQDLAGLDAPPADAAPTPSRRGTSRLVTPGTPPLDIKLLGPLEARVDGVLVDQWVRRKAQLVLAALALYPRGLALPELAELMGGEEAAGSRFTALKVAISYLRHALEPTLPKGAPSAFVGLEHERYQLVAGSAAIDVRAFEVALDAGDRAGALALYRGNLLDEPFFQRYFEAEREQLRGRAVAAALALAAAQRATGELAAAEGVLSRIAAIAQTDEAPYEALMDLYLAAGLPEKARQAYWDCRKARKAQLGLPPSDELEGRYRAIATR